MSTAAPFPAAAPRQFGIDQRFVPPILITLILVVGQTTFGILEGLPQTLLAIVTAMLLEAALARIYVGTWPHLASAYITGISVGILVRSPEIWPFAVCAALSITSKYVLRWRGRHLWNPSNFGICALLFLAPYTVASLSVQWGNNLWPMLVIWLLGAVIIYRLRRFHITAAYVAAFLAFGLLRSVISGHPWQSEIAPITGPMYQLFCFFMVTDPKTTVRSSARAQVLVVIVVALVEAGLRLLEVVHAPYYALFLVGPTAVILEELGRSRRGGVPFGA
ncbi:MAG: hypothetical protein AB7H93_03435 [Vicinamibacterales bacterium]